MQNVAVVINCSTSSGGGGGGGGGGVVCGIVSYTLVLRYAVLFSL